MQYPLGIPPALRTNIDYVFLLRENNARNRKVIYENYAGMFPTQRAFEQVMDQCTENHECLVIANNALSNKLEDQVFWYKADTHDAFRVGAPEFWRAHEELCGGESSDDEELLDISHFTTKKGPNITVKKNPF